MFEIGSSLRDARVRKALELTELEAETKIRAKYLRALEDEQFDLLPGDTYVKGFLRIYAERLGLDGQLYVDEYNSRFSLVADEPAPAAGPGRQTRQGRFEANAVALALAGIVAVTVLVIAAWQIGGSDDPANPEATTAAATAPAATETVPAAAPPVQLLVTARAGSSRVEVRRGTAAGELLWEGTLARGDERPFEGTRLWVFLAKAQNVALTVNGEAVPPVGRGKQTVLVTEDGVELASS